MPSLPTIACKECGHTNEGERIYCHGCGAKLDRTTVVEIQQQKQQEVRPEQVQKRLKKMMNPQARFAHRFFRNAARTLSLGALSAALVAVALPPKELPSEEILSSDAPRQALDLVGRIGRPGFRRAVTEDEINGYLKANVRLKTTGPLEKVLKFDRVFATLEPAAGAVRITVQKSVYGYPLYAAVRYRLAPSNGTVEATPLGLEIGRLHLPAQAVAYSGTVFAPVWESLKEEQRMMGALGGIDVREKTLIFSAAGSPPLPPESAPAAAPALPAAAPAAPSAATPAPPPAGSPAP